MPPPDNSDSRPWWQRFGDRYLSGSGRDEYARVVQSQPEGTVGHAISRVLTVTGIMQMPHVIRNAGSRGLGEFARNEELIRAPASPENIAEFSRRETAHFANSTQLTQRVLGGVLTAEDRGTLIHTSAHGGYESILREMNRIVARRWPETTRYFSDHNPFT